MTWIPYWISVYMFTNSVYDERNLSTKVKQSQTDLSAGSRRLHLVRGHATDTLMLTIWDRRHVTNNYIQVFEKRWHATVKDTHAKSSSLPAPYPKTYLGPRWDKLNIVNYNSNIILVQKFVGVIIRKYSINFAPTYICISVTNKQKMLNQRVYQHHYSW